MSDLLGQQLWSKCINGNFDYNYDEVQQLVDRGANLNWKNEAPVPSSILEGTGYRTRTIGIGWTPLINAAVRGNVEIIRLLLDHGADMSAKSNYGGMTALHGATNCGHGEVVRLLIERGADLHVKDNKGCTPFDIANIRNFSGFISPTSAIIEAAIKSTKVIYIAYNDFRQKNITFKDFDTSNIIILTDNDIPERFAVGCGFKERSVITLQNIQQCIDQIHYHHTNNDDNGISTNDIDDIVARSHPVIATRLQHWEMNALHLLAYLPPVPSNDMQEAISSLLTKYSQAAMTAVDIDGMTPLHHAAINLSQKKICQKCHDLLLKRSPPIVVHQAIKAGISWDYLRPIVMVKVNALTLEDEESGLMPFMLAAERCKDDNDGDDDGDDDDDDSMLRSLSMAYELLCLKPDVLKEYDASNIRKRVRDESSNSSSDQDAKRVQRTT